MTIPIQDKINIEISKAVKKLREEVIMLRALVSKNDTLVREHLLIEEEVDRVIDQMIDKQRGK